MCVNGWLGGGGMFGGCGGCGGGGMLGGQFLLDVVQVQQNYLFFLVFKIVWVDVGGFYVFVLVVVGKDLYVFYCVEFVCDLKFDQGFYYVFECDEIYYGVVFVYD